ncbi:hypothetical protein [Chitinophaga arvensicola]|uniref:Trypsin n=1 Tax=Chitinophaga arvensicola TaxID=29529 RepID=A0A1I0R3R2_9BACT|nr:hypothetical protein [Chitinophaga arvensicola]SEW34901.1 hypothetical protein SAMN04488122_2161 [Chitinophaga arvensicola]
MLYLIDLANELGAREIVTRTEEYQQVHHVLVAVDPQWIHLYKLYLMGEPFKGKQYTEEYLYYKNPWEYAKEYNSFPVPVYFDIHWRPPAEIYDYDSNLIIKILLRPGTEPVNMEGINSRMRIIQEHAPVARFQAINAKDPISPLQGGVSISPGAANAGTLGGILRDRYSSDYYGLTCGHVAPVNFTDVEHPSTLDHSTTTVIGSTYYVDVPSVAATTHCTMYDGTTFFHQMDLSLIKLNAKADLKIINIGRLDGIALARDLYTGMWAEFNGRTSGHRTLILGAIGITGKVDNGSGSECCFEHLVQLQDYAVANLNKVTPTQDGDSGAWVIVDTPQGRMWAGMVIGGDRKQVGWFIMAEKITDHLKNAGFELEVA